jgi:hypothetical protein
VRIKFTDLVELSDLLQDKALQKAVNKAAKKAAKAYYELLISNMKTNKHGFKLAMSTIQKRLAAGKVTKPFIFYGAYIDSIYVWGTKVLVKKGFHYSKLSYKELSFILEYGRRDKSIPSRPIWRKTLEDFKPQAQEIFQKALEKHFQ